MALLKDNPRFRFLFFIDVILLFLVIGLQAASLDYVLMRHFKALSNLCIFTAMDLGIIVLTFRTFVFSYQHFSRKHQDFPDGDSERWFRYQKGTLPMSYCTWFLYVTVLLSKLAFICIRPDTSQENPQILQVCLAVSTIVFMLLVEGHNWGKKSSESYSFTTGVCKKNGIEIYDSVEMLELLLMPTKLSSTVKLVLFFLVAFNFILPTLSLYRLSLSDFGTKSTPSCLPLKILQNALRFTFVDVPFFGIRLHTWIVHGDLSIFMMKNFFNILMALRELYLDVCIYFKSNIPSSNDEIDKHEGIPLDDVKT